MCVKYLHDIEFYDCAIYYYMYTTAYELRDNLFK